ncbi:hypothetical protein CDG81_18385 [Actinopolyspora erythraea]|uniref:Dihydrodipicolinate synthase family protein n=1 Tax=Actinopolyspora erythraea TaxID=414996 RepID=A0A223RVL9_9ACTN|nr:hypothetical protein CDG81_18385 [Actinopolyspora erythraea]
MPHLSPPEVARRLASGLLSFPVTHFRQDLSLDESAYRENIRWLGGYGAAGLFAAGGTGEFFSLTPSEVETVVTAAVEEVPRDLPMIAPAGHGTATAVDMARAAERSGEHGLLLLPRSHHRQRLALDVEFSDDTTAQRDHPLQRLPVQAQHEGFRRTEGQTGLLVEPVHLTAHRHPAAHLHVGLDRNPGVPAKTHDPPSRTLATLDMTTKQLIRYRTYSA